MDLLEAILRSAGAEKYIEVFSSNDIHPYTIKLLTDEDLICLGVDDKEIREQFLLTVDKMQIPSEKLVPVNVNNEYLSIVLPQISTQIHKHYANLSCAILRDDLNELGFINVKVHGTAKCLVNSVKCFEKELDEFEEKMNPKRKANRKRNKTKLMLSLSLVTLILFGMSIRKYCIISR